MRSLIVASCVILQGCAGFIYIPGGLFQSGNSCGAEGVFVGQIFNNTETGKGGVVKEIHGRSERCQNGRIPILVTVEYE